ncbi:hypothetical protein ASPVEDRAFT_639783 [Aspergillus versicolor CBS 583.65]|uniref:Uncharacterized protein n=1 Tax=Aspergillus versicolor CBS 583.65 TaxID=1036611 RepID=A0A1L9PJ69_ASPVE|nr:uncharacterized protein ASPVEDRAFT_639783 [Aspergillus versicolor CBS 583.65]OJJ01513.1 hypothetical protein ASPVEDRAFT_639783 [Aspergillus versicolor CBS 583.65]
MCSGMGQYLTVQIEQIDDTDLETSIDFGVTLAEDMSPKIHDLCSHPWEITNFNLIDCPESQPGFVNKINDLILNAITFSSTIDLFIFGAVAITIASIAILTFFICRNTIYCRRRRADRAAKREERRTRRAYKFAARRLRWKKWWDTFRGTAPLLPSSNNTHYHEFTAHGTPHPHFERQCYRQAAEPFELELVTEPEPRQGSIQAEIRGFRQALQYVGELVRHPADRNIDRESGTSYFSPEGYDGAKVADSHEKQKAGRSRASSSTAGTSTVLSLRTISLGTEAETDIDLSSHGTPPPSYHE